MKDKNVLPITKKTVEEDAKKWLSIIKYGESGTIIQLQDDCEYYLPSKLKDKYLLRLILGPYYKKYVLGYMRLDEKDLFQEIRNKLIEICDKRKLVSKKILQSLTISEMITIFDKAGYTVGLYISHITALLNQSKFQTLFELEHLLRTHKNLSVVMFSEIDILQEKYNILIDKCSSLYTNILVYPLYADEDAEQFIRFNESLWNIKVPDTLRKQLISQCGGYLWLLRNALRYYRLNPEASVHEILINDLLLKKTWVVWEKFSKKEQETIKKIITDRLTETDKKTREFKYLLAMRGIKLVHGKISLSIPILQHVIKQEEVIDKIQLENNKIYLNNLDISHEFSNLESRLLEILLLHKKTLVSRDNAAQHLWGDNWEDKYSDWAIDRLLYRLRIKLKKLGIPEKMLKAVKRKGILFG